MVIPETWVVTDHSGDKGNSFGPKGLSMGSGSAFRVIEVAQIIVHEADEPKPAVNLLDAYAFARKHLAQVDGGPRVTRIHSPSKGSSGGDLIGVRHFPLHCVR